MTLGLAALLLLATSQSEPPVTLRWRVPKDGAIAFRNAMERVEPSGTFSCDKWLDDEGLADELKNLKLKLPASFSTTTILAPGEGDRLSVRMTVGELKRPEEDGEVQKQVSELLRRPQEGVLRRADITDTGALASWWLESRQASLVALFLERPDRAVRVGDSRPIGVRFLTLAGLEYTIVESPHGDFENPMSKKLVPSTLEMSFVGKASFLVRAGRWRRFEGRRVHRAGGMSTADAEQTGVLEPLDRVRPELRNLK